MTPSELKARVEKGPDSHFFDCDTMRFFGDRMSNYRVVPAVIINGWGETLPVWELRRKRPVKHGLWDSAYFRKDTFERVFT